MRLRITCNYPKDEVKAIVRFASKGVNHKHLRVWIKNCFTGDFQGWYYHNGKISARIGGKISFPHTYKYPGLKRAPEYTANSWQEVLVCLVSHEMRHHYQNSHHKRMSEIDAERWAVKKLNLYRISGS